jgi:hypothetical protein
MPSGLRFYGFVNRGMVIFHFFDLRLQALAPLIKQIATDIQSMLKSIKEPKSMGTSTLSLL